MVRLTPALLLLIGCSGDTDEPVSPSAFEGFYEVSRYLVDGEACGTGLEEPYSTPFFELVVAREGNGDVLEVQPCDGPGDCLPANHFEWLFNLFETGVATGLSQNVDLDEDTGLCTLIFGEMTLTVDGDTVSLVRETFYNDDDVPGADIAACERELGLYAGERVCVVRRQLDGTRQ